MYTPRPKSSGGSISCKELVHVHCIYLISDEEDPLPGLVTMTVKLDTSYRELREIDDITCITHSIHMYITTSQRTKCMHMELVLTIYIYIYI